MLTEIIKAVILGIVQGITEWLPVSSTGHMLLVDEFLQMQFTEDFVNLFIVLIQLGSILAVLILFFHKLNPFALSKSPAEKKSTWNLWGKVLVGAIPTGLAGLLLDDLIDAKFHTPYVIAGALIVYGVIFILVDRRKISHRESIVENVDDLTYKKALGIGLLQIPALIPGVSRSGSSITGGLLLGASRTVAAEFSFFMALPLMVGASGYKLLKYVLAGRLSFDSAQLIVLAVGSVVAFVVSLFVIRALMRYIRNHNFTPFGIYRIALGAVVLIYFLFIAQ